MFITFEGGEGTGKTTQARRLVNRLTQEGYQARLTKEPGGNFLRDAIRSYVLHTNETVHALAMANLIEADERDIPEVLTPLAELLLFSADRAEHVREIRRWLSNGEIVVSDRYVDATRVYQGTGRGVDSETVEYLIQLTTNGLMPDLTILFDLPIEEGLRRKRKEIVLQMRQPDLFDNYDWNRIDDEEAEFHEKVRNAYLALKDADQTKRWFKINAASALDVVEKKVYERVKRELESRNIKPHIHNCE